jgi:hypothetical protein
MEYMSIVLKWICTTKNAISKGKRQMAIRMRSVSQRVIVLHIQRISKNRKRPKAL